MRLKRRNPNSHWEVGLCHYPHRRPRYAGHAVDRISGRGQICARSVPAQDGYVKPSPLMFRYVFFSWVARVSE